METLPEAKTFALCLKAGSTTYRWPLGAKTVHEAVRMARIKLEKAELMQRVFPGDPEPYIETKTVRFEHIPLGNTGQGAG